MVELPKRGVMKRILWLLLGFCPLIIRADCPDVLYSCFADKTPNLFTYEEMDFYNTSIKSALEKPGQEYFPFVSVGTYWVPFKGCIKKDVDGKDTDTRAANYCKAKYPNKKVTVEEFKKPLVEKKFVSKDALIYGCLENNKPTKWEVLANDSDTAQLKCQFIAAALSLDTSNWGAKRDFGFIRKVKLSTDENLQTFINEWAMAKSNPGVQHLIPDWLKDVAAKSPAAPSNFDTLTQLLEQYRKLYTADKKLLVPGESLKSNVFSSQSTSDELKRACKRLKLLYHPDKHLGVNQKDWEKSFKTVNNECETIAGA